MAMFDYIQNVYSIYERTRNALMKMDWICFRSLFTAAQFAGRSVAEVVKTFVDLPQRTKLFTSSATGKPSCGRLLAVEWSEVGTSSEIGSFRVGSTERIPSTGSEDVRFGHVVHIDGDSQDGGQRDQIGTDMPVTHHAVICAPIVHHRVDILEHTLAGDTRGEPRGRPGRVGALIQRVMCLFGDFNGDAFSQLQYWSQAFDQVKSSHCCGHATAREEPS